MATQTAQTKAPLVQRLLSTLRVAGAFVRYMVGNFIRHQGPQNAASLTYGLLLSLVPLMTVTLALFSAFPMAEQAHQLLQGFLFDNFVPAAGEVLQSHLTEFSSKASRLSGAGFLVLIVVALLMMNNIDRALNTIWESRQGRSPLHTFLVYWAVLSLGPVLIGASVVATSYLVSLPLWSDTVGSVGQRLFVLMPVLASMLGFAMLYLLVPNRRVLWRHALLGGLLAGLLFEAAKRGFAAYITHFPTYEAIYGALAAIPIFLVWIYLSAMIMLLGAEFTRSLGVFRFVPGGAGSLPMGLGETVRLLGHLSEAQLAGRPLSLGRLARRSSAWNASQVELLLSELRADGLVHRTDSGRWVLARPLASLTLYDLYRATGFALPVPGSPAWPAEPALAEHLLGADRALREALGITLDQLQAAAEAAQGGG